MKEFWSDRKVLVTGHTGFKGAWLSLYLNHLGADVTGYALEPITYPSLFAVTNLEGDVVSCIGDLLHREHLEERLLASQPEVVFHLAAKPLVRYSYSAPVDTFNTNVMGTVHLLEACRRIDSLRAIVVITSDKCYENREWHWPYRETDRLGGHDPYSSSKACVELVCDSYRNSFFNADDYHRHRVALATTRAGNVIGGGDWSTDRLIPDAVKAIQANRALEIRSPDAVRPWQHVLDPLHGYLLLAQKLIQDGARYNGAWNFGPGDTHTRSVRTVLNRFSELWDNKLSWRVSSGEHPHEAQMLTLDSSKSTNELNWKPRLDFPKALELVAEWYQAFLAGEEMSDTTYRQISEFASTEATLDDSCDERPVPHFCTLR